MADKLETLISEVSLVEQGDLSTDEAFASVTLNPTLRWMKFILTDDIPNQNKQRVPQTEFANLISSGVHMPIKMALEKPEAGHDKALPLGVITNLKQIQNRVEGLAALWSRERPEDVDYIINEFKAGRPPQLSWEIPYTEVVQNNGVEDLTGICLRAATIVGLPAYAGRTPVLAVASTEQVETNMTDEIETVKTELEQAKKRIVELEAELTPLKEFKANYDKEQAEAEKLASIKAKFAEANLVKDEEYFTTNKDMLLSIDEAALNFMIQEMVAFAKASVQTPPKTNTVEVPSITNNEVINLNDPKALAKALKGLNTRK